MKNTDNKIPVKIDKSTTIFINPGTNPIEAKKKWLNDLKISAKRAQNVGKQ